MNLPFLKKIIYPFFEFWLIILFLFVSVQFVSIPTENDSPKPIGSVQGFFDLLPTPAPYPFSRNIPLTPDIGARSAIAVDLDSMVTLYEKDADTRLLPASTTKMMTALIVLENYPLDRVLVKDAVKIDGTLAGLKTNERMTVSNLLYAMLIGSGNDAAYVLAENYPGGNSAFVEAMNQKAQLLRLKNTHWTNSIGLDQEEHYSSARDLMILAAEAIKNPFFARVVSIPEVVITDITGKEVHWLKNTNELIGKMAGFKGIKTGKTEKAGECLVALFEKDSHRVITVILNSQNRIRETENLTNWISGNFYWDSLIPKLSYR